MDLTTVARVKELSGSIQNANSDAVLARIIAGRSADAEGEMRRFTHVESRTERLNVLKGQKVFRVKWYPIQSLTSIINDGMNIPISSVSFDDMGLLRIGPAFGMGLGALNPVDPMAASILTGLLAFGPGALQVTGIGGMATDTADFISKYPDIAYQMDLQVLFDWQRKDNLTNKSVAIGDGQSNYNDMDWIPSAKKVLARYRKEIPLA